MTPKSSLRSGIAEPHPPHWRDIGTDSPPSWKGSGGPIVGRDDELRRFGRFLGAASEGGDSLLLSGDPGVGKTTVLGAVHLMAADSGWQVLRASGVELEAKLSFSVVHQLLTGHRNAFAPLSHADRQTLSVALGLEAGPSPSVDAVTEAFTAVLRALAADGPVLVLLDDLQWVDPSSADVLGGAALRPTAGIVIIAAYRTGPQIAGLQDSFVQMRLAPLSDDAAETLLGTCFPMLAARVRRQVLNEAQGNPLALQELPAALAGTPHPVDGLPSVPPLTDRLSAVFSATVNGLPAATRDVMLRAALSGNTGSAGSGGAPAADLDAADRAGLITIDRGTGRWAFRHPLVRATVVGVSTASERRRAHRRIAEDLDSEPDRQAWHMAHATSGTDEDVAVALERSAERAAGRGDAPGAVELLVGAAGLSPAGADRARRLAAAAYLSAAVTGELARAAQLLAESDLADAEHRTSLPAGVTAAFIELNGEGNVDEAHRLLVTAMELHAARFPPDDPPFIEAVHHLFEVCLYGARPELWASFEQHVAAIPPSAAPVLMLCRDLLVDPFRRPAGALDRLESAIAGLQEEADPTRIVRVATAAIFVDRSARCRSALHRALENGRAGGAVAATIRALLLLALDAYHTGRWAEAQQFVDDGLDLCAGHGDRLLSWPLQFTGGLLAAARGDARSAASITDAMTQWASPRRAGAISGLAHHVSALAALGRDDFEDAYRHAEAIAPGGVLATNTVAAVWVSLDLVDAAMHTGRRVEAAAHVAEMRAAGIERLSPRLALGVYGAAGMVADAADYQQLFETALLQTDVDQWPFDAGRIRLAYGERLRRAHATLAAREQLDAARSIFARLGAAPWLRRATDELRATAPTKSGGTGSRPRSLTPQEYSVARLAAAGLTNKQIAERLLISPRTVGAHLRQVFTKLGIVSRAAIGGALPPAEPHSLESAGGPHSAGA